MRAWILLACVAAFAMPVMGQNWYGALELLPGSEETALVADADGDGDQDLLRLTIPAGSLVIHVNDGSGGLQAAAPIALPTGARPPLAQGDFNGDGVGDLVIATDATGGSFSVVVLPGTGGGAFGLALPTLLGGEVRGVGVADIDGDNRDDLAVAHDESGGLRMRWLLGTASGFFTVQPGVLLTSTIGFASVAVADLNADGVADVAHVDYGNGTLYLLPTVGNDTSIGPTFPTAITSATDLLAGDVDGDGDDDLVVTEIKSSSSPIQAITQVGTGQWAVQPMQGAYTGDHLLGKATLADWDGDGSGDILVRGISLAPFGGPASLALLQNDGTGTWTTAWTRQSGRDEVGGPFGADLDGDGNPDLVGAVELMYGDGTFDDPYGSAAPFSLALDYDDDGDPDGLVSRIVQVNDGTGAFTATPLTVTNGPSFPNSYGVTLAHADFNGDGRDDQLVPFLTQPTFAFPTFVEMRLLITNPDGTLTDQGLPIATGIEIAPPAVTADLDGDGDVDVANGDGAWINTDGMGNLSGPMAWWPGYSPVDTGDVDQDGDSDLLALSTTGSSSRILFNVGGSFIGADLPIVGRALRWVDLEGDGDLDTIAIDTQLFSASLTLIEHPGTSGNPPVVQSIPLGSVVLQVSLSAGDVDGDGQDDVVAGLGQPISGGAQPPEVVVVRHLGPGFNFGAPRRFLNTAAVTGLLDIDGDGDLDLIGTPAFRNRRFQGPAAGVRRQYGAASPAGLAPLPLLGATGPFRPGLNAALRVRHGVGGTTGLMSIGTVESALPNLPYPGLTVLNFPWIGFVPVALSGGAGVPGAGSFDLPFVVPPSFAGQAYTLQVALLDGTAPVGITYSNGLELRFGL